MSIPRVEEICIPESLANGYSAASPFNSLVGIKRLNAFVGPNNSGKSRLLRELFLVGKDLLVSTDNENARKVRDSFRRLHELRLKFADSRFLMERLSESIGTSPVGFHLCGGHLGLQSQLPSKAKEAARRLSSHATGQSNKNDVPLYQGAANLLHEVANGLTALATTSQAINIGGQQQDTPVPFQKARFVYIPTLRGMRIGTDVVKSNSEVNFAYFDRTWWDYMRLRDRKVPGVESLQDAKYHNGKDVITGLDSSGISGC